MNNKEILIKLADDLEKRVDNYANKLITDEIKSCKKMKWVAKRYFKFKEKYSFDKVELLKVYVWAKQFKHVNGPKGIKGEHIELHDSILFDYANILCIKKDDGNRVFKKGYIQKARKNVKTEEMAILLSYVCANSKDEQQEGYIGGWNKKTSKLCYKAVNEQLKSNPKLKGKWKDTYGIITFLKDGSTITPLSQEDKNTGDGTNPSIGVIDEFHNHKTSEIYDVLDSGMAARDNPLMFIITTPGFNLSYPCYKEYQYVSKILDPDIPDIENDEYYVAIYEMEPEDDIKDESNYIKSNPVVATNETGLNYLRGKLKEMTDAPEKKRNIMTKNFGIWVDMREEGYMNMTKWGNSYIDILDTKTPLNELDMTADFFNHFKGQDCILGVDLSTKLDLTSIAFEFLKDDVYYTCQHSWMPRETYDKRMKEGKYRFDLWKDQGFLTITPGATIDYDFITDYIHQQEKFYNISILEICYDPMNATQWIHEREFEGYTCVEVRQGPFTLNEPTKDYRDRIYDGSMKHSNDGLYTWTASNAVATQHKQEYIMLDKKVSAEKIDPMAATMNAHYRAMKILENPQQGFIYVPTGIRRNRRG